ncbi:MAG: hypothetical protein AB1Z98_28580 [Nannocystaceae bacterium]
MTSGDPRFSDDHSALILQRAAELQAQQGRGLSLTELEAAAAEVGIDTALVRRAAAEVSTRGAASPPPALSGGRALGAPLLLLHERVVAGPLSPSAREDAVREIHRQLGNRGRLETASGDLVWSTPRGRGLRVSICARAAGHIIRVEERLGELAGGLFLGMALPVAFAGLGFILPICIAVLGMPWLIPLGIALWFSLAFALARTIYSTVARQRDAQLRALADGLEEICLSAPAPAPAPAPTAPA